VGVKEKFVLLTTITGSVSIFLLNELNKYNDICVCIEVEILINCVFFKFKIKNDLTFISKIR
jgi:hypothetical protein